MKLIDEFKYALWEDTDATGDEVENKCEKITEKFAIGFLEWKDKISDYDLRYSSKYAKTNKELLKIYKTEKGL